MTVHDYVQRARRRFVEAGIDADEAALDAELLARATLGWDLATFLARAHESSPPSFVGRYDTLVARRERREPVSYILGRREFWGLDFEVGPGVLTPRPESEMVVEEAVACFFAGGSGTAPRAPAPRTAPAARAHVRAGAIEPLVAAHPARIADVGTGTGCLAISLALEFPAARVVATDISPAALAVARRNVARHRVAERVHLVEAAFLDPVRSSFDLIVSNPPYVPTRDLDGLPPEVRDYEPRQALDGGADGLDAIRAILDQAESRLNDGGWLVFEFGFGQAEAVTTSVAAHPALRLSAIRPDLQGIPRTAVVERPKIEPHPRPGSREPI